MTNVSCRKSKRVAKRQEDEIFWLLHNFPQGLEYDADAAKNKSKSPQPHKTKDLIISVSEKLKDESTNKIVVKMPRMLRSGKTIRPPSISESDSDKSSDPQENGTEKLPCPSKASNVSFTTSPPRNTRSSYSTRSRSLNNLSSLFSDNEKDKPECSTKKRKSSPLSKPKTTPKKQKILSREEQEQWDRIERSKLPKFQVEPNKISTRSGAQYPFTWKDTDSNTKSSDTKPNTNAKSNNTSPPQITSSISTRSSGRKPANTKPSKCNTNDTSLDTNTCSKSAPTKGILRTPVKIKQEPKELEDLLDVKPNLKKLPKLKLDIDCKVGIPYPKYMYTNGNCNKLPTKTLNVIRKGKRKRLSLLPTQKPDKDDDFTATWFDALNARNQSLSPLDRSLSSCSRSASPISPTSSVSSENNVPQKRTGRTASLNCRAVLSALMKPEPVNRKQPRKSPPKTSPKSKPVLKLFKADIPGPDSFFKVKVNSSYCQKVEYHHNGIATKIYHAPNQLRVHESAILSQYNKVKVTTNGWEWLGSYIDCCSFYTEENNKSTRLYFSAMYRDGVELRVGDSVALQTTETDTKPFVGKIVSMWQDNLGEMMVTMCWFYRPSDLENIKTPYGLQELYLSKHTDDNSVATIQNKVHVLSYPEYCRYYSHLAEAKCAPRHRLDIVPNVIKWRAGLQKSNSIQQDLVYFCRGVYDFRLRRTLKQQLYYTKYL